MFGRKSRFLYNSYSQTLETCNNIQNQCSKWKGTQIRKQKQYYDKAKLFRRTTVYSSSIRVLYPRFYYYSLQIMNVPNIKIFLKIHNHPTGKKQCAKEKQRCQILTSRIVIHESCPEGQSKTLTQPIYSKQDILILGVTMCTKSLDKQN